MESDYDDKLKWGQELLPLLELTPRLAWLAGGGSGEPQAGKVGQWCLVFTMCPVSSVIPWPRVPGERKVSKRGR